MTVKNKNSKLSSIVLILGRATIESPNLTPTIRGPFFLKWDLLVELNIMKGKQ